MTCSMSLSRPASSFTKVSSSLFLVGWYTDGGISDCLIVQIQDHRRNSSTSQTSSATAKQDRNLPFSIHNYSEHLTPSPYVPYPLVHDNGGNDGSQSSSKPSAAHPEPVTLEHDRREGLSHGQHTSSVTTNPQEGPRIFTTVLFPTPKSLEEEVRVLASTPDLRALGRKQSQANARPSSSATASHPPTPSSAIPSTPMSSAPPAKKQKMLFTGPDLAAVEGRFIASTAQPLFLDPVDSQEEAQELLAQLHDPLFCEELPVPKTRKRTVRELEADEALAAAEQQFMLVMDERLVPSATGAASHNAGTADGDSSIVSFEPRFERFKAIEEIRLAHREKAQREAELKAQQNAHQQLLKTKQEQQARENQLLQEQRMGQFRKQEQMRQVQNSQIVPQTHQLMQQQHVPPGSNQHGHPQMSNTMLPNSQSLAISQAHHSSPIVRNMTPHNNISPLVGDNTMTHGGQGVPMKVTTSNQGAGSPPRPGSAVQHGHPSGSAGMAPQRSQQPPTRNGTPQIPGGTPRLQQAVPVMRNVTPTPRMTHGSPGTSGMVATPIIGHAMMPTPHINGQHLTPQQQQILNMQQRQAQSGMQGSPPAGPSPPNLAQLAALRAQQQSRQNNQVYQQQLRQMTHQQMSGVPIGSSQYHNVPVGMQPQGLMQPQNLQTRQPDPRWQAMAQKIWADTYSQFLAHAQAQYGQNNVPGEVIRSLRDRAKEQAIAQVTRRQAELNMRQAQEQAQEQAQQQAMQQRAMMQQIPNGGMSGGGGMNGRPMNGMNGMNAMNGR